MNIVLILTMLLSSGGAHVTTLEGFQSEAACVKAAEQWSQDVAKTWLRANAGRAAIAATCVAR